MKEKLDELYEGLKERLKSSFLITFIIIWLLHHWRLIYTLFNFDKDQTLISKRAFIAKYISDEGMLWLWIAPLLWSFGSMILFYGFSSLSELLNIRYHNLRKKIYKRWENKKIKTIEEYLEKVEENEKLQLLIKDLEQRRELLLGTNKRLEDSIGEHNKTIHNNSVTMEGFRTTIKELSEKQEIIIAERTKEITEEKDKQVEISKGYQKYYGKNQDFSQNVEIPLLILLAKVFNINNKALLESQQGQNSEEPRDLMEGVWSVKHFQESTLSSYNEDKIKIQNRNMHDMQKDVFLGAIKSFSYNKKNKIVSFVISNRDNTDINIKLIAEHKNRLHGFWNEQVVSFHREDVKL